MKHRRILLPVWLLLLAVLLAASAFAGCKKETFTVRFLSDDGSVISEQTVASGDALTVPPDPKKTGYAFAGWQLDGNPYDFSQAGNTTVTGDMTFTAVWEKNTWTVSFWDGEQMISTQEVARGSRVTAPAYAKPGYTVLGWYEEGSETPFNFNAAVSRDMKLYLSAAVNCYTVRFFDADGTTPLGGPLAEQVLEYGAAIDVPAPVREHAVLLGWRTASDATPRDLTGALCGDGDVDYVAVWQYDTVRITFYGEDGETVLAVVETPWGSIPVYNGKTPEKTTDDGRVWTFAGWDRPVAPATEDASYTAVFKRNTMVQETDGSCDTYDEDLDW